MRESWMDRLRPGARVRIVEDVSGEFEPGDRLVINGVDEAAGVLHYHLLDEDGISAIFGMPCALAPFGDGSRRWEVEQ